MLLRISRHDFLKIDIMNINIDDIIRRAANVHKLPNERLLIDIRKRHFRIIGNANSLSELVMILLDNALRYSPPESQVTVTVQSKRDGLEVRVINTGPGIQPNDLPHIFERFYRADKSRTSGNEDNGFGLGLSLAKRIADLHNAKLTIASTPGKITTATLRFEKA